ncbi:ABC-type multidrug transport system, ATPase and permease component [Longilinea arvoryzae]|uniref:ABC-type multidrug transport system, ATPase and permease component n=1 Tax=Longilinea arvoryzae TaxID=360412 RepID=A0A0S7BJ71_9CHLR|nr:ABC transporter ATP-binding protein [Longilinea arvoryzae]GAP13690.1 ABC-type multidrug transport system, ATPase and permease component [Longilinea arvoryzae]
MYEVKRILHFVKPYRKLALISLVMLLIMVVSDLSIPRLVERIIDQGIRQNNLQVVLQTSAIMLVISVINTYVAVLNNNFSVRTGESTARDIREAIFVKIQELSYGDLDRFSTGKLMVRLTSDASAVQRLVQVSLRIGTRAPLLGIGSIILMFITSRTLATAMIPLLLVASIIIIFFSIKMEPLFRIVQLKLDRLNTVLQENIAGARLVKAFVRGDHEAQRFRAANEELTDETVRVMQYMSSMSPLLTIFINFGVVLVIWFGGRQAIQGSLQLGQIVAFINYLLTTMTPLIMMTQLSNTWANGLASARRINEVLDVDPEVPQSRKAMALPAQTRNQVDFQEVAFHYRGNSNLDVLEGINLQAEPGQTVALLGATGAGKSSLINLIPRFYDATRGQVNVDDRNVRDLREDSLLAHIGIVPQETILFSGTIRENIAYGKPDATEEEVIAAAKIAQAHDFILHLPQGYDTHVEERGANLSGGQKQRIAIARSIITRPPILILDDATSSVDVETETQIQDALNETKDDRTTFVVAQRISTVLNADKIVVLDKGRIMAEGKHADLIKTSPIYQEIYESQLGNGFSGPEGEKTR